MALPWRLLAGSAGSAQSFDVVSVRRNVTTRNRGVDGAMVRPAGLIPGSIEGNLALLDVIRLWRVGATVSPDCTRSQSCQLSLFEEAIA